MPQAGMEVEDYMEKTMDKIEEFRRVLITTCPEVHKHYPAVLEAMVDAFAASEKAVLDATGVPLNRIRQEKMALYDRALLIRHAASLESDTRRTLGASPKPAPETVKETAPKDETVLAMRRAYAAELSRLTEDELTNTFRIAAVSDVNAVILKGPRAMINYLVSRTFE